MLLVAKKRAALVALHAAWRAGDVDKRYQVLVRGRWRDAMRRVSLSVHKFVSHDGERAACASTDDGQAALTIFRRVDVWLTPRAAAVTAGGRAAHLRQHAPGSAVHPTHLRFPLAGDDKYGDFAWNRELAKTGLKRMFLHAARLSLAHPLSGEPLQIESPLPADLANYLQAVGLRSDRDA